MEADRRTGILITSLVLWKSVKNDSCSFKTGRFWLKIAIVFSIFGCTGKQTGDPVGDLLGDNCENLEWFSEIRIALPYYPATPAILLSLLSCYTCHLCYPYTGLGVTFKNSVDCVASHWVSLLINVTTGKGRQSLRISSENVFDQRCCSLFNRGGSWALPTWGWIKKNDN